MDQCFFYFVSFFFKKDFIYLFLEREERKEKRGREASMCKRNWLVASCMLRTRDLAHNPGMYPDRGLNQQPFGLWDDAQLTEPQRSGLFWFLCCCYLSCLVLKCFGWQKIGGWSFCYFSIDDTPIYFWSRMPWSFGQHCVYCFALPLWWLYWLLFLVTTTAMSWFAKGWHIILVFQDFFIHTAIRESILMEIQFFNHYPIEHRY